MIINVDVVIMKDECPSLFSNRDMIVNGLDISLQGGYLHVGELREPLVLENYFFVYRWTADEIPYSLYTEIELRKIHKGFGHPSVKTTYNLLSKANIEDLPDETMRQLKSIESDCHTCKVNAKSTRRFRLTVGTDDFRFNHHVIVDMMFINSRPVLHMVDESTHYQAASFLKSQSTSEIWKSIQRLWILTYLGPPDYLSVDQGTAYISAEMKANLSASGITLNEAPIENPGSIGLVERYHAPLRCAFAKLRETLEKNIVNDADCLQMAVFATNATMGPEGLCPMLLVFGAMPRPARTTPSPKQLERQRAIEEVKRAVESEQSRRRIAFALRHPISAKARDQSTKLMALPSGSPVLVYRTTTKTWEGPFKFISCENETVVVQLSKGRRIFRTTCVKPYTDPALSQDNDKNEGEEVLIATDDTKETDLGNVARKVQVKKGSVEEQAFKSSRLSELEGLVKDGTFVPIHERDIVGSPRIFGSRFVDELKKVGDGLKKKSRLVAQNYADEHAGYIPTKAPTVQRFSQRIALCIAASLPKMDLYTRDITQAYIQSHTELEREVYIKAPPELGLAPGYVLKVVKPLYGIPESGLHWYLTYLTHHLENLGMTRTKADPCVLVKRKGNTIDGVIMLQVDDSLGFGTPAFLDLEESASKLFRCKPRTGITSKPISFNGIMINKLQNGYRMSQTDKVDRLTIATTQKAFSSQRAAAQYIGVNTRPDICAAVQLIAPGNAPTTPAEFKSLSKSIKFLQETKDQGLTYVNLDLRSARIVLLTDASFANAAGMKSQLGYLILMADDNGNCNLLHYGSNKCQRIARSVMAAEIQALVLGFDFAFLIKDLVDEILGTDMRIEALIDSKTVFNVVAKDGKTAERILQIDILAHRQSYDIGELDRIAWIPGNTNPADSFTKTILSTTSPLFHIMQKNKFTLVPQGWANSHEKTKRGVSM